MSNINKQRGFTLIEIAIVLVIIGLLLGGVLKGQELITSARVRNLITQQDGIKAAYFGFQDRFHALPGDYSQAKTNINLTTFNGNGNGQIENSSSAEEDVAVWEHLSRSGFITGTYTFDATYKTGSAPANPYTKFLMMRYDNDYSDTGTAAKRHNLRTGNQVPSDILAEVDRKVDDGNPKTGSFRFSKLTSEGATGAPDETKCVNTTATPAVWNVIGSIELNCGGTSLY